MKTNQQALKELRLRSRRVKLLKAIENNEDMHNFCIKTYKPYRPSNRASMSPIYQKSIQSPSSRFSKEYSQDNIEGYNSKNFGKRMPQIIRF